MQKNLPIAQIRPFEAAGRTGSFKSAAEELNLSPSAISHSIRSLERNLGVALFERTGKGVRLSPDGFEFYRHVSAAFDSLRYGYEVVSTRSPGLLRLHCAPSFAAQWLTPRLPRLVEDIAGIDVRLSASAEYVRFEYDEFDADIVYGLPGQSGQTVFPLGEEVVTPLCAPQLARSICSPADLLHQSLIESDNKKVRWSQWFAANGLEPPRPNGSRFDRSFLAIAFAVDGMGVALESTMLAERELSKGTLVAPLLGRSEDVRYVGHHLVLPANSRQRRVTRQFANWIFNERGLDVSI